ncbi:restriction endonuclease subunit S [Stutzerimonas stutzeri]|nr:restriction endonuclease subunit S [Stutzerimonas stutzeri]
MSSEVGFIPLRELSVRITKGTTPTKGEGFAAQGINYIKSESITSDGSIDASKFAFINAETHDKLARSKLRAGNVLFSMAGVYLGKSAVVLPEHLPANTNQAVGIVTLDESKADPYFIHYSLQSPACRAWVLRSAAQSAQPNFNLQEIGDLKIPAFHLARQKEVAGVLRMLDDRITLLRETNATLEAIAQALFKSWFVDFDPVRARAEGRQPEGMDATTSALFPDSFEESELGLVPKGWSIGSVGDLASQKKGSVNPLASPGLLYEHYSLPAFDSGQAPVSELGQEIKSNKTPLPEEAVLLSKLNPHIPRVWLPVSCGANAVCSTEFLAYSPRDGASKELIYCLFGSSEFQQQLCQLVTGTSNSHQRVKPDQVLAIKLPIAGKPALKAFTESVRPLFERVHANRLQAQTLTQLRDTLLPRLISGQLRLPEAQALLNDRDIAQ